jgi:hypothetical protein
MVRQQNLQIADGALLLVIAAGIAPERCTPLRSHTDVVTELVQ